MFKVETRDPPDRCFEDFPAGLEMPVIERGRMTAGHQVRWAGACDNYASEFHHDAAVARAQGLPGLVLSGPFMASILLTEVTFWLGARARVLSFSNRNSAPTAPGDTASLRARVERAEVVEGGQGRGRVEVECSIVNQDGKVTTPATLVAELPLRAGGRS